MSSKLAAAHLACSKADPDATFQHFNKTGSCTLPPTAKPKVLPTFCKLNDGSWKQHNPPTSIAGNKQITGSGNSTNMIWYNNSNQEYVYMNCNAENPQWQGPVNAFGLYDAQKKASSTTTTTTSTSPAAVAVAALKNKINATIRPVVQHTRDRQHVLAARRDSWVDGRLIDDGSQPYLDSSSQSAASISSSVSAPISKWRRNPRPSTDCSPFYPNCCGGKTKYFRGNCME